MVRFKTFFARGAGVETAAEYASRLQSVEAQELMGHESHIATNFINRATAFPRFLVDSEVR